MRLTQKARDLVKQAHLPSPTSRAVIGYGVPSLGYSRESVESSHLSCLHFVLIIIWGENHLKLIGLFTN